MFRYYLLKGYIIVIIIIILFSAGCSKHQTQPVMDPESVENPEDNIEDPVKNAEEPVIIDPVICPLGGEIIEKSQIENKRAIAVMIDNHPKARPQSGLADAEVVYELPVEGGITRFLALFLHNQALEIGPVRSARHYYLDLVMEYNAVYAYFGGSPQAWEQIPKLKIEGMNGIHDGATFYRYSGRKEPHDKYTSIERIRNTAKRRGYDGEKEMRKFYFNEEDMIPSDRPAKKVTIIYPPVKYTITYEFDPVQKVYLRYIENNPHLDANNNKQIQAKNIIIQSVNAKVIDSEGRLDIQMVGKGKGYYISNGCFKEISWQKETRRSPTRFLDKDNNELKLNTGNTWVHLVPQDSKIDFE